MLAPATVFYAVGLVLMKLFMVWRIIALRQRHAVGLGDGDNRELRIAIRIHGNFMEYMPLMLLLMFMAEMNGVAYGALHGVGLLFVLSRGAHALGMAQGMGRYTNSRAFGVVGTWVALLMICGLLIHNVRAVGLI